VNSIGYGLMGLTWRPKQTPDEQAFETMRTAIREGCTFWNGGEFYGQPEKTLNLQLLNRYFKKYPEDREKVFISIKGGLDLATMKPTGDKEGLRKSVENSVNVMGGYIDLFECARVDKQVPIEETMETFKELIKEGKIKHVGLSECSAETIRKAHKVVPIAAVEQEYSLWSTEIENNGVLDTCKELGIPLVAYSPLGRGFLTGTIKKRSDIPEGDFRLHFERFSEENFDNNLQLVSKLQDFAKEKGCTPAQLAIGWVLAQWDKIIAIPGSTTSERVNDNVGGIKVQFSDDELKQLRALIQSTTVKGGRYNKMMEHTLFG